MNMQMMMTSPNTKPVKDLTGSGVHAVKNAERKTGAEKSSASVLLENIDFMSLLLGLQSEKSQNAQALSKTESTIQINPNGLVTFQMAQLPEQSGSENTDMMMLDKMAANKTDMTNPFAAMMKPVMDTQSFQTLIAFDDAAITSLEQFGFSEKNFGQFTLVVPNETQSINAAQNNAELMQSAARQMAMQNVDNEGQNNGQNNSVSNNAANGANRSAGLSILFDAINNLAGTANGADNKSVITIATPENQGANTNMQAMQQAAPAWQSEGWSSQAQSIINSGAQQAQRPRENIFNSDGTLSNATLSVKSATSTQAVIAANNPTAGTNNPVVFDNAGLNLQPAMKEMLTDPFAQAAQQNQNPYGDELNIINRADAMRTDPVPAHGSQTFQAHLASTRSAYVPHATQQVAFQLQQSAQGRLDQIQLQMNPAELGRLKIKLHFGSAGEVKAHIIAEKPETLEILKKDSGSLEDALAAAGFDANGGGSLEFSLGQGQDFAEMKEAMQHKMAIRNDQIQEKMVESDLTSAALMEAAKGVISMDKVNILV